MTWFIRTPAEIPSLLLCLLNPAYPGQLNAFGLSGRILFCVLFLLAPSSLIAGNLDDVLAQAERMDLARDPTWLKLLHFERDSQMSVVLTDSFFLAPDGRTDPGAELEATLAAYFGPEGDCDDNLARCRFPARYYWLSHQLHLPGYQLRSPCCRKLERWALFDLTQSISLLLVSGYLGNPASTFGHSLIKLNTDSSQNRSGLLDLTLNFGALVPANENPLFYVVRGLTGSYEAGFSDRYFYSQDLVYSRTEFRDMWEYRLELNEFQRTLMILHIWEIAGKKFQYYFLDKNCGYRLAELLELVLEEEILDDAGRWYIPVDLFHRILEIDRARQETGREKLVKSVRYIPSSRRKLFHGLALLEDSDLDTFNLVIEEGVGSFENHLGGFSEDRNILLLDALLAYQQYRLIADRPDSNSPAMREKDRILLARLHLPGRSPSLAPIPELTSPADGFRPLALGLDGVCEPDGRNYGRLSWSPYKKESVGQNSLEGNEFVFLDIAAGVSRGSPAVFLDRIHFIRILSLNTIQPRIKGESRLSWKLHVGLDRYAENTGNDYDAFFSFGTGQAWKWNQRLIFFGLVNGEAHADSPFLRVFPESGLIIDLSRVRAKIGFGMVSNDYSGDFRNRREFKILYRLNKRQSIHLEHRADQSAQTAVGLTRYF